MIILAFYIMILGSAAVALTAGIIIYAILGMIVRHANNVRKTNGLEPISARNTWSGLIARLAYLRDQAATRNSRSLAQVIKEAYEASSVRTKRNFKRAQRVFLVCLCGLFVSALISAYFDSKHYMHHVMKLAKVTKTSDSTTLSPLKTLLVDSWDGSADLLYTTGRVPRTDACVMAREVQINGEPRWEVAIPFVTYFGSPTEPPLVTNQHSFDTLQKSWQQRVLDHGRAIDMLILKTDALKLVEDASECPNSWAIENHTTHRG